MRKTDLEAALAAWAPAALSLGRQDRVDVRRRVRIPGVGPVDLMTVRQAADEFAIGLWLIQPGEIRASSIDAITRRLHAFDAWYADLVEKAEIQGFRPNHGLTVAGNLVGHAVRRGPLVDLLSNRGSAVRFWTWRRSGQGIEVAPFCGTSRALASSRGGLKGLLPRLTWEDAVIEGEAGPVRPAVRPSSLT